MKTKFLITLTILFVTAFALTSSAQNGRVSLGAELALPSGDFGESAGMGFGGSLRYEHPMGDNLGLMLTVGYLMFGSETVESGVPGLAYYKYEYTSSMIPIMAGAKYYFSDQQEGFYGKVQLGITMLSTKSEVTIDFGGSSESSSDTQSNSAFTWSPGIGYCIGNIDIGFGYYAFSYTAESSYTDPFTGLTITSEATASGSWMGLRLAYMFGEK
jgi:hypothetical protein